MGVVIMRWVWLECIGVVSGCCKVQYIDILIILLIPTPLVLAIFAAAFLLLCSLNLEDYYSVNPLCACAQRGL